MNEVGLINSVSSTTAPSFVSCMPHTSSDVVAACWSQVGIGICLKMETGLLCWLW